MFDLARNEEVIESAETGEKSLLELAQSQLLLVGGGSGDVLWG